MKETLLVICVLVGASIYASSAVVTIFYAAKVLGILRTRFPRRYAELGEPRLLGGDRDTRSKYSGFIMKREYLELDDQQLNHAVHVYSVSNKVGMIGFLAFLVALCAIFAHV